jgi:hypothetical protein
MDRSFYNTYEGVLKSLSSYEEFTAMLDERRTAGYDRGERLYTFYLLGRFLLDGCGNCGYATNFIPAENIPDFPQVALHDVFWQVIKDWQKKKQPDVLTDEEIRASDFSYSKNKRPFPISISFGMENIIPPASLRCPHCQKGWAIENCHDVEKVSGGRLITEDSPFTGITLGELREEFAKRSDAMYYTHNFIYNNDVKKDNVKDNYVLIEGDKISYGKVYYYHSECFRARQVLECEEHRHNNGENYEQLNLAGNIACDEFIKLELELAGINIVEKKGNGEVPYNYEGRLGDFTFRRAWSYWGVHGDVPLKLAKEMY